MLRGVLGKTFRLVGYTIQYGCIAHCAFEYVGGVVMVSFYIQENNHLKYVFFLIEGRECLNWH